MSPSPFTAVLIDDHPLLGLGLKAGLADYGVVLHLVEPTTDELVETVARFEPDGVVVDLAMPIKGGGLSLIEPLVALGSPLAVLTGEVDQSLWATAIALGATVVLSKGEPIEDLFNAVWRLCRQENVRPHQRYELGSANLRQSQQRSAELAPFDALTPKEQVVLDGLVRGVNLRELADREAVSVHTVRTQAKSVLKKLGVHSQLEAVAKARAVGWAPAR